jgi:6-phospho-3-hexuloisomerase
LKGLKTSWNEILSQIENTLKKLDPNQVEILIQLIIEAKENKIFIVGMGRSGLVGRGFALRLMNLGLNVYITGETITPAATSNDLMIAISGSGITKIVLTVAKTAKEIGMTVIGITSHSDSLLGKIADHIVIVGGRMKEHEMSKDEDYYLIRQLMGGSTPLTHLGTMFENNCMIFLDSLTVEIIDRLGTTHTSQ